MTSHLCLILGASIGALLTDGMKETELRDLIDKAIKSAQIAQADPGRFEALADVAITTAMDIMETS